MILNQSADRIFQSAMSVMIFEAYSISVSGVQLPLHGCWGNPTRLDDIYNSLASAFEYVF